MLVVIPLLLMAIGAGLIWLARRLRPGGDRFSPATATVVALRRRGEPPDWFPVMQFRLPDGHAVEAQSTWGSRPPRYREGDRVEILYDPRDPSHIRLPGEAAAGAFLMIALVVAGIGFLGLGALLGVALYALSHLH